MGGHYYSESELFKRYCLFLNLCTNASHTSQCTLAGFSHHTAFKRSSRKTLVLFLPLCLTQAHTLPPRPSLVTIVESMHPKL